MKLVRYGALGAEKPGIIDANGVLRDLSGHVSDIAGDTLSDPALQALRAVDHASLPEVKAIRALVPASAILENSSALV